MDLQIGNVVFNNLPLSLIEAKMKKEAQADTPVTHFFAGGVYVRQIFIPAGTLILGKRHRHETCNMLLQGRMLQFNEADGSSTILEAPAMFKSMPGTRKLGYALEDSIFCNIHPTDETNLEKIEEQVIIPEEEYQALIEKGEVKCLG